MTTPHDLGAGIHCLEIPTPFPSGPTNVYLLDGEPLTLIDTGLDMPEARAALLAGLRELNRGPEDIELVLLTHHHVDHVGLAPFIVERAGCEVWCLAGADGYLADFAANVRSDHEVRQSLMIDHGVPRERLRDWERDAAWMSGFGQDVPVDRTMVAGEVLELGSRRVKVLHRPGHSHFDTVFWDSAERLAFVGDHLLVNFASNALVERMPGTDRPDREALLKHRASMIATRQLGALRLLAGHGGPITSPDEFIEQRLAYQNRRATALLGQLGDLPRSAYELAVTEWGERIARVPFMAVSAALGHLALIDDDAGVICERDGTGAVRFRVRRQ